MAYPVKGDLITMSLGNVAPAAGTQDLYRVLNISGSIAEVVAMYDISTNQQFGTSQVYSGSLLDTALNTTWYNTLSTTAKAAIVDKTFKQDSWYWGTSGSPVYSGYYGPSNPGTTSYSVSLANSSFGSEITRKVYALSVQDVLDYVTDTSVGDGKLQNYNIWNMFWNTTSRPSTITYPWLRSAFVSRSSSVWGVRGNYGYVFYYGYDYSNASRPAFKIDLSKISWKKDGETTQQLEAPSNVGEVINTYEKWLLQLTNTNEVDVTCHYQMGSVSGTETVESGQQGQIGANWESNVSSGTVTIYFSADGYEDSDSVTYSLTKPLPIISTNKYRSSDDFTPIMLSTETTQTFAFISNNIEFSGMRITADTLYYVKSDGSEVEVYNTSTKWVGTTEYITVLTSKDQSVTESFKIIFESLFKTLDNFTYTLYINIDGIKRKVG